jgi:hypothetical protein
VLTGMHLSIASSGAVGCSFVELVDNFVWAVNITLFLQFKI